MRKKIIVLVMSILCITGITFVSSLFSGMSILLLKRVIYIILNLLNGGVALLAIKLTGINIDFDLKNKKQFFVGLCLGLSLTIFMVLISSLFGFSLGGHVDFLLSKLLINLFFYMIIIGPVEELIFRVYIQETIIGFFKKNKWIGVIITSLLFGLFHLINGSYIQVLFTFGIGLIFGFTKYLIKDCKYLSLAIGHGLYDFFIEIIRMIVI